MFRCGTISVILMWSIGGLGLLPANGDIIVLPEPTPMAHYSIESDQPTYELGDPVDIMYRISNVGEADLVFEFGQSPGFEVQIFDEGELLWESAIIHFQVNYEMTVSPGESWDVPVTWNQADLQGRAVEPGIYELRGVKHGHPLLWGGVHDPADPSIQIAIVPEPSIAILLMPAAISLLRRRPSCAAFR